MDYNVYCKRMIMEFLEGIEDTCFLRRICTIVRLHVERKGGAA